MSIRFGRVATQINRNQPKQQSQNIKKEKIESTIVKEPTVIPHLGVNSRDITGNISRVDKKFVQLTPSPSQVQKDIKEMINTIFTKKDLEILFFADERCNNLFQSLILPQFQNKEKVYIFNERFDLQIESIPKCNILFIDSNKNLNLILREVVMKCKGLIILHLPNHLQDKNFNEFKQGNPENSFYLEGDYALIDGRKNLCFDYSSISELFNKVENSKIIPIKSVIQSLLSL